MDARFVTTTAKLIEGLLVAGEYGVLANLTNSQRFSEEELRRIMADPLYEDWVFVQRPEAEWVESNYFFLKQSDESLFKDTWFVYFSLWQTTGQGNLTVTLCVNEHDNGLHSQEILNIRVP